MKLLQLKMLVILKQNQENKKTLQGVKFQILNENKEVIYADLKTDDEGKIVVENLLPGKYYIQEMETLEGYEMYDKLIEVDLKLNEETKVTINNLPKDETPEVEKTKTELEVEQIKTEQEHKQQESKQEVREPEKENYINLKLEKEVIKLPKTRNVVLK